MFSISAVHLETETVYCTIRINKIRYTLYFQFISIINLCLFQADLLLIIRRYYSVCTVVGICHVFMFTGCLQDPANRVAPPDDEH